MIGTRFRIALLFMAFSGAGCGILGGEDGKAKDAGGSAKRDPGFVSPPNEPGEPGARRGMSTSLQDGGAASGMPDALMLGTVGIDARGDVAVSDAPRPADAPMMSMMTMMGGVDALGTPPKLDAKAAPDVPVAAPDAPGPMPGDPCVVAMCSGARADKCCPAGCSAVADIDCAGCGNGRVESGEQCDPLSSCPQSCPQMACTKRRLDGAGTCGARCLDDGQQTQCVGGDGCCPSGCNRNNDADCASTCDNGVVEGSEFCDPLTTCPVTCPMLGCTKRMLTGAQCGAHCVEEGLQTACNNGDGCCPPSCNKTNDSDCAIVCGNSVVETGETCDPLATCPTACPQMECTLRKLVNAGTCAAQCVDDVRQTACVSGDGCCPGGCNRNSDNDCAAVCGNSVLEMGETCDPQASCVSKQSACQSDANIVRTGSGDPTLCTFICTEAPRGCGPADGFCPATNCGPTMDVDCPGCGNGKKETGELCDPPGTCPTMCAPDANACTTDVFVGSAMACTAECRHDPITACGAADGCCPSGCGPTTDVDCAGCGNGTIEKGEICDPPGTCPTTCAADKDACTADVFVGSAMACTAECRHNPITACTGADGCCAPGCTAANDSDCAGCGNGKLDPGEYCDPPGSCPTTCVADADACTMDVLVGSAASCTARCEHPAITVCKDDDGCCPSGCNTGSGNLDNNCSPVCGNTRVEARETCDPSTSCPNANNCVSTCEETATLTGDPQMCSSVCARAARMCSGTTSDGCCPKGCDASTDRDCAPANDKCANATDISAGGRFPINLWAATEESKAGCSLSGTDVFYAFKLETTSVVYLDAQEAKMPDAQVPLTIELLAQACDGTVMGCDPGDSGEKLCGVPFPRIDSGGAGSLRGALKPGLYFVVVRAATKLKTGIVGEWILNFNFTPTQCIPDGRLALPTAAVVTGSICSLANESAPSCAQDDNQDANYVLYKCPNRKLTASTCNAETTADTILEMWPQGARIDGTGKKCVAAPSPSKPMCTDNDDSCTACDTRVCKICDLNCKSRRVTTSTVSTGVGSSGIFVLNIDHRTVCDAQPTYGVTTNE